MSHRGSQPATARHEDAPQCYDPGEPRLTDEEWDKVNGIKNGPPTPITDEFVKSLNAAKVPEARCFPHWLKHSKWIERQLAEANQRRESWKEGA